MKGYVRHGHASRGLKTATYFAWQDMKKRCSKPDNKYYSIYGGRGISVCDRWKYFPSFLEDMGPKPEGFTLERINNDLGYKPSNCRWATPYDQNRNTRRTKFIEFKGKRLCQRDWEIELGFVVGTLHRRFQSGWNIERALTTRTRQ